MPRIIFLLLALVILPACSTAPPSNVNDICDIFEEKDDWYDDAADAAEKWNVPLVDIMAIMHQESRFVHDAQPPRRKILWIIPGPRLSSAYGYPQAKTETWETYQRATGEYGADRDDFEDAADFVGWYTNTSYKRCGINRGDTYASYLAYHEGHGGYNRRTYDKKAWLKKVARKVEQRAQTYRQQLASCEKRLKRKGWFDWF